VRLSDLKMLENLIDFVIKSNFFANLSTNIESKASKFKGIFFGI